ncbi:ATP-dependent helicase [Compostimonas suwonensis]|uniref:ATP-dependent helicase n=1 Tax=Compostimonas suwonensis TaxID=1048394 RepID=UPI000C23DB0D|nr:ATP-dependent DNA helicase [Compostimonas suwonensis]
MIFRGFQRLQASSTAVRELELDDSQKAVLALPGDATAAVLGAPGTGKTTTLVELVADRVQRLGLSPDEIVVLAPTRQAASRLRDTLSLRLGVPTNGPMARTANSLAFRILSERAAANGDPEPPRLLTGSEQDTIISELLDGHEAEGTGPQWPESIPADVRRLRGFRTELRELIMRVSESGLLPAELSELGRLHGIPEWVAAGEFIAEYHEIVDSYRGDHLDSAELLAEASLVVRRGEALGGIRLVVVDDLQEATLSVVTLLRQLAGRGVPVIAFGDPDVATSAFRGAQASALGTLAARLGVEHAHTIVLEAAHRQGPALRELTAGITERIGTAAAGRQRLARPGAELGAQTSPVVAVQAASPALEFAEIARRLREHHLMHGVPWSRMAVIVRSGAQIPALSRALALAEVPTTSPVGGHALRDDPAASQLVRAANLATGRQPLTPELATELLLGPLGGLDGVGLRRVRLALRHEEVAGGGNRPADELLVEALDDAGRLATIDSGPARRAARLATLLAAARDLAAAGATIEELLWLIWERSGLAPLWFDQALGSGIVADEANRNLDGVVALFTSAKRYVERVPDRPASEYLADFLESEVPEDTLAPRSAGESVLVSTPNGTIGAEFEIVAVARLQESVWPNLRLRGSLLHPQRLAGLAAGIPESPVDERAQVLSDELRMFALAASRATRQVILSSTANEDEQPSPFTRLGPAPQTPDARHPLSLRGLVGSLRRRLVLTQSPEAAAALARLAAEGVPGADPRSWYGLTPPSTEAPLVDLSDPDAVVPVSPSRLETFEKSPLAWFIDSMAASPSGAAAGIGTLVHAVMEEAGTTPDADVSVEGLWAGIERRWEELRFDAPWLAERERRRTRQLALGLSEYLGDFEREGKVLLGSEGRFSITLGRAQLNGSIDRVEMTPEGAIVIVDLKTGRYVPSAAAVATHAQLGSYQLAVREGAIEAVPGDARSGGAKLVFVAGGIRGKSYRDVEQGAFDEEAMEVFRDRIADAVEGMAGARFEGVLNLGERDPHASWAHRIHLVAAVSA